MKRIDHVFQTTKSLCEEQYHTYGTVSGIATASVAEKAGIQRTNASADLNLLVKTGRLKKTEGKPVLYRTAGSVAENSGPEAEHSAFDTIIGADKSLKAAVQQAKAAMMYPTLGLHTLLLGETGVGKSMFAETMFRYAQNVGRLKPTAPFVAFNCADYAHNPQLLLAHLFGVKKGSYTGAEKDRPGLVEKANNGILFLDEVHRLPPEGQEMLFYFIDKGLFHSLGEVEAYKKAEVLIICATTENVQSTLLSTFTRRIPMLIKLPPIRERTINERWELIKFFFMQESQCLSTPIAVSLNSLKAFLLYDCPNNIGQLKSDIRLSCARAFLDSAGRKDCVLRVCSEDLPEYILRGFVHYKKNRAEIDGLGLSEEVMFKLPLESAPTVIHANAGSIYEMISQKIKNLQAKGLKEEDIQLILGLDIDNYVKQYMAKLQESSLEELYKIVDRKVVTVTQEFLRYAAQATGKIFDDKILFGIAIHISSTLERIKEGKPILNPHLAEIQKTYPRDFATASHFAVLLKDNFAIQVPDDEIGFITMFIVCDEYIAKEIPGRVGVIIAMHGYGTATAMADVANRLLGGNHAAGYDLALDKDPSVALEEIIRLVEQENQGQGVIMLVDMGSLVLFGDIICEHTRIPIKIVEMASTPMVLEAVRKSLMRATLAEIYYAVTNLSPYIGRIYWNNADFGNRLKADVIVTACITGKGTAILLKNIIEKALPEQPRPIDVIPIEIASIEDYNRKLGKIKQDKNLLAVASSIKPADPSIKYISAWQLMENQAAAVLAGLLPNSSVSSIMDELAFMRQVINENLTIDGDNFMDAFGRFLARLAKKELALYKDSLIGLVLHLACVVDKLTQGETIASPRKETDAALFPRTCEDLKAALQPLETAFNVTLPAAEYSSIGKLLQSM